MAKSPKINPDELIFLPLGGSNEIGMNLNCYQLDGKWLLVDMGIGFADDYLPGVEVLLPDIEFLLERKADILGLVITHAHEDHIGAIPYLWEELECPIYGSPFALAVLKHKLMGEGINPKKVPMHVASPGKLLDLGPFNLDFIAMTHSVPEMQGIAITTRYGTVLHSGDWKLDPEPLVGPASDEARLKAYGDRGVLAMVCDSTNVFVPGRAGSEAQVREGLTKVIKNCKERVVVTTFASNIARVESIMVAAKACGRSVVFAGRSLFRNTEAAREAGYLKNVPEAIDDRTAAGMPRDKVVIIATGGQGEPRAALTKLATGAHPALRLAAGDTIVFSSRVIPGNDTKVRWLKNEFIRAGIDLVTDHDAEIHVSGHPARDELADMYRLVRPRIAVPVHGEAAHLKEHSDFARSMGVEDVVLGTNGAVIRLAPDGPRIVDQAKTGYIAVDGNSFIPVNSPVIKARRKLRDEGNITVSLVIDGDRQLASAPQITAPGSLDSMEDEAVRHALEEDIIRLFDQLDRKRATLHTITDKVKNAVRKRIAEELGKRPLLEVHLHQI